MLFKKKNRGTGNEFETLTSVRAGELRVTKPVYARRLQTCSMMMKQVPRDEELVKLLRSNFGISIKLLKVALQAFEKFRIFSFFAHGAKQKTPWVSNDSLTSNVCFWELWEERFKWDVSCLKLEPGNWLSSMLKLEHMDSRLATRSTTGGAKKPFCFNFNHN